MDPVIGGALVGGALGIGGGFLGNRASAEEARRNRKFQKRMYRHRYQYTVEDMRRAGLNPALAYQQGGGSAPSGSMASQDDPLSGGIESAGRAVSTALGVQQAKANIAQTQAQTSLTKTQEEQLRAEGPWRADWWKGRPGELAQRIGLMGHQASIASATANYLEETFRDRVSIAGLNRQEAEAVLKQMALDLELAGLTKAPLEAQAAFARSWAGRELAPAMGSAQGVAGIVTGLLNAFLGWRKVRGKETTTTKYMRGGNVRQRTWE